MARTDGRGNALSRIGALPMLAIVVTGAYAQLARAQTAPPTREPTPSSQPEPDTADIIVTAQKRSESINRVPLSITAVSGDDLAALGVKNPADLTRIVSGFQAVDSQIGSPIYFLRGVGYDDISVAARPSVTLYSDEAPIPYSVMAMGTTLDLERVEVLKGPQGLLFGSNATGGAINFVAAKPTDTTEYGFDASLGRFLQYNLGGFVSGPLAPGLNARLAVSHDGGDGWQYDYLSGRRNGALDRTSARLTFDAQPTDRLTLRLTLSGTRDRSEPQTPQYVGRLAAIPGRPAVLAYPIAPRNNRATGFDAAGVVGRSRQRDNSQWQATLRADYTLTDDVTLTALTSYAQNKQDYGLDADGMQLSVLDFTVDGRIKSFTQEARLDGSLGSNVKWIVGGNIERDTTREVVAANIPDGTIALTFTGPPFNLGPIDYVPVRMNTRFRSEAAFANIDYTTGPFALHAGARYTHTRTKDESCTVQGGNLNSPKGIFAAFGVPASFVNPGDCLSLDLRSSGFVPALFRGSLGENNVSWRVGADYKPDARTMLYASASRGYKAGAYSSIAATFINQYVPAVQERLTAYEVGIKSDIVPGLLHTNAALFYYDYTDKQVQGTTIDPVFGALQALVNIPKSRVQGAELEATLRPARGLTLGAMATYVDSKVTGSFPNPTRFGVQTELRGTGFPRTPRWQVGANAEYRTGVAPGIDGFIGGNLTYRSTSYGDFVKDDRLRIDAYTVIDAQLGIEAQDKSWTAQLFARNLFDTYYWTNQIFAQETLVRYTGTPATYGVRLSFRFK